MNMNFHEKKFVVIFKSVSESEKEDKDAYYEILHSSGFRVTLIPVLDFEFINTDAFLSKINNPDDYEGIIFTSPRCVAGFQLVINMSNNEVIEKWKNCTHFVVGEKTAEMAENLGISVKGREAGNGDKLAEIISKDKYDKPFLYPIGSLTQKGFKLKLKELGVDTEDVLIYQTKAHSDLKENIEKIKFNVLNKMNYFIYFSPSGVNFSFPILKELNFDFSKIQFVAIGPTTKVALLENGVEVSATATKPNPNALLDAILSLQTS